MMKPQTMFHEVRLLLFRLGADTRCTGIILRSLMPIMVQTSARTYRLSPKEQVDEIALGHAFQEVTGNEIAEIKKIPAHEVRRNVRSLHKQDVKVSSMFSTPRNRVEKLIPKKDAECTLALYKLLFGNDLEALIRRAVEDDGQHGSDIGRQCAKVCTESIELGLLSALASHDKESEACANLITHQQGALLYGIHKGKKNVLYAVTA